MLPKRADNANANLIDVQTFHTVAHGAEADAQKLGSLSAVVTGLLQRLFDNAALDLVKVVLNLHGARVKRRKRLMIQSFAFLCFGIDDVIEIEVWMVVFLVSAYFGFASRLAG